MERTARLEQVVEQILGVPVHQITEDISERTLIVDMPLLQTMGTSPRERVAERTPQMAGEVVAPVPLFREETGEVLQLSPLQHAHFGREPFAIVTTPRT